MAFFDSFMEVWLKLLFDGFLKETLFLDHAFNDLED